MAASAAIVPRDGLALTVGRMLDAPELAGLVEDMAALRRSPRGRPGYTTRSLLGACLVKSLYGLPTWAQVARLIGEHPGLQAVLGGGAVPSGRATGSPGSWPLTLTYWRAARGGYWRR